MKFRKGLSTVLCAAMLTAMLAGCGSGEGAESSAETSSGTDVAAETSETAQQAAATGRAGSITMGVNANIPGLSCYDGTSTGQLYVSWLYNDSLFVQETPGGELKPCIGKDYEVSEDGSVITVHMFDYVKDSAGNPITASDVVFSYNTYIATGNASNVDPYLDRVEAVDDTTVALYFKDWETIGAVESVLTYTQIVDEEAYDEATWSTAPIGCGPYVVEDFVSGSSLTLAVNEDYWQTDEQYISTVKQRNVDRIIYRIILEDAQLALALETGDVDVVNYVSTDNLSFFMDENGNALDGYYVRSDSTALVTNISFSMDPSSNVADDVNLRKAILHCIDKASLVSTVVGNTGKEVFCFGTDAYSDYDPAWAEDYFNYDVELAQEYLAQSNYVANGSPTIRIALESNDSKQRAAQMMQAYMNEIGINAEILSYDAALFTNYKLDFGEWDIKIDNNGSPTYNLGAFWQRFLGNTFCTYNGVGVNFLGLNDPELQELLDVAANVNTMSQENTNLVNDYINDNAIVYGLWTSVTYQAAQDGILEIVNNSAIYPVPNAFVYAEDYQGVAG